jgi:hypothetical protein
MFENFQINNDNLKGGIDGEIILFKGTLPYIQTK